MFPVSRRVFFSIVAASVIFTAPVNANAQWIGHEKIYEGPTDVNLGGRPVVADIALHADMNAAAKGVRRVALVTDVTPFVADTERDLETWVAAHQERCGERWSAGKPIIDFPPGAISFALHIELAYYTCGLNGQGEPSQLTVEGGDVSVVLKPYVEGGKLQTLLADFAITNRSGVSKYLPLEFVVRRVLEQELNKLNENRKFYRAPNPFNDEGYGYESLTGMKDEDGRIVMTARFRSKGDASEYGLLAERIGEEGLTQ
ncbi:MAG: hypothetical protein R3C60_04170 [Parvularculaceae bacterium]